MKVHIIADSACDLPLSYFKEHSVSFLPLSVDVEGQLFQDQIEITPKQIYDKLREGITVKTSQVSPHHIKETFTELAKKETPCVYIAFSSELSGTYQTAMMVRNEVLEAYPNFQIEIIDSKCASLGQGLAVKFAVDLALANKSLDEIKIAVTSYCSKMEHIFTVDNLEHLAQGGRISKTSAFVGGLLNIKPLLQVVDGKLVPLEKLRGRKKVFRRMVELMKERGVDIENQVVAISHADDEEAANELKKYIREAFSPKDIYINYVGAVIGAHAGPGALAVFFLNSELTHT